MNDRRLVWIGVAIVAIFVGLTLVSYWAWSSNDSPPGSCMGDVVMLTTP